MGRCTVTYASRDFQNNKKKKKVFRLFISCARHAIFSSFHFLLFLSPHLQLFLFHYPFNSRNFPDHQFYYFFFYFFFFIIALCKITTLCDVCGNAPKNELAGARVKIRLDLILLFYSFLLLFFCFHSTLSLFIFFIFFSSSIIESNFHFKVNSQRYHYCAALSTHFTLGCTRMYSHIFTYNHTHAYIHV